MLAIPGLIGAVHDVAPGRHDEAVDIGQAAFLAADDAHPSSDLRGPAEYKISMVRELTKRALTKALNRASQKH